MWLSSEGKDDVFWWMENLENSRTIKRADPVAELFTDASEHGCGSQTGVGGEKRNWLT